MGHRKKEKFPRQSGLPRVHCPQVTRVLSSLELSSSPAPPPCFTSSHCLPGPVVVKFATLSFHASPCITVHDVTFQHCPHHLLSLSIHTQLSYQAFGNSQIGLPFSRHFLYPGLCKYLIKENKLKIIHGAIKYSTMTVVINTAVLIWKLLGENCKSCHHKERKICNYGGADRC